MFLGIDLGTSNSAIVGIADGAPRLFKTAEGTDVLPSVIYIDKAGRRFVGGRAYDRTFTSPEHVGAGFKRLMGTGSKIAFKAAGVEWTPEECSAEVLRTLVAQARVEAGDVEIEGTVITVPAAFDQMQSEATLRAARLAGLDRVALLQEPVAASMASIANSAAPNGLFLIYDLGGGTFDAALVQSVSGVATVLAHQGVNMLGGRDFDRILLDACVRPWLQKTFSLPADYQRDPGFGRLNGIARHAVEKAKIDLSTAETATIYATDEDIRLADADGEALYLSIEVSRRELEALTAERVDETVALCRKMLRDNGVGIEDVSRVVLIGGPTKMPSIRDRVPRELGLPSEPGLDPMTAVAIGAAIFAESREWSDEGAKRRQTRRVEATTGGVKYVIPERVSDVSATVAVSVDAGSTAPLFMEIKSRDGVSSGRRLLDGKVSIRLDGLKPGRNEFEAVVTGSDGRRLEEDCRRFTIHRGAASVSSDPVRQTIAVKVQSGQIGYERNVLEPLVVKGASLPAEDVTVVRAAKSLKGGEPGEIRVELFETVDNLDKPELALLVGEFRIDAMRDLDRGEVISRGEEIPLRWRMNESGLLTCAVELRGRIVDEYNLFVPQSVDYRGRDGAKRAEETLSAAEAELRQTEETLGAAASEELETLRRRAERQHEALSSSTEAETNRGAELEALRIRQDIALLRLRPEHREAALTAELDQVEREFDELRSEAASVAVERFDRLVGTTRRSLRAREFDAAARAIDELQAITRAELFSRPDFLAALVAHFGEQDHLAVDKKLHERLNKEGLDAIERGDVDAIRAVIGRHFANRNAIGGASDRIPRLSDLMRR